MNLLQPKHLLWALAIVCWKVTPCAAQLGYNRPVGSGLNRPTTSPYLNLNRGGNPALNYYNLVRPEFEFRNAYQGLQGQLNQQQQQMLNRETAEEGLPVSGHATRFFNYSHYYPSAGPQRASLGQGRTAPARPQR